MGLDMYRKAEAMQKLEALQLRQEDQELKIAEGTLGLRDLRANMAAQGASAVDIQKAEKEYLKSLGDATMQMAVIQSTNKVTKGSLSATVSEADAVAQRRIDLEQEAASLSGYVPYNLKGTPTDEDLQQFILQGKHVQGKLAADTSRAALEASQTSNAETARRITVRNFGSTVSTLVGAQASSLVTDAFEVTDFKNPAQRTELIQGLQAQALQIRNSVQQAAQAQGLALSREELDSIVGGITQQTDLAIEFLQSDAVTKMNKNTGQILMHNVLFEALNTGKPSTRNAAASVIMSLMSGAPVDLTAINNLKIEAMDALVEGTAGKADPQDPAVGSKESDSIFQSGLKAVKYFFTSPKDEFPEDNKKVSLDVVTNNFTGSSEKLNSAKQKQVQVKIVEAIANGDPDKTLPAGSREEVLSMIRSQMEPKLLSTLASFLSESRTLPPAGAGLKYSMRPIEVEATGAGLYSFNPETLQVRPTEPTAMVGTRAKSWNKLISDTIKAYEKLGAPQSDIEVFKDRVRNAFGLTPPGEGNGSEENENKD